MSVDSRSTPSPVPSLNTIDLKTTDSGEVAFSSSSLSPALKFLGVHKYDLMEWMTSWCLSAPYLFGFRLFFALYLAVALAVDFIYKRGLKEMARFPFYFTYISTFLCCLYFALTAYWSARNSINPSYARQLAKKHSPYTIYWLHFLYAGSCTFHLLVPPVYWGLVFSKDIERDAINWYTNISTHCIPILFLLFDFVVNNRYLVAFADLVPILLFMMVYMLWAWLAAFLHFKLEKKPWWVYKFMSWDSEELGVVCDIVRCRDCAVRARLGRAQGESGHCKKGLEKTVSEIKGNKCLDGLEPRPSGVYFVNYKREEPAVPGCHKNFLKMMRAAFRRFLLSIFIALLIFTSFFATASKNQPRLVDTTNNAEAVQLASDNTLAPIPAPEQLAPGVDAQIFEKFKGLIGKEDYKGIAELSDNMSSEELSRHVFPLVNTLEQYNKIFENLYRPLAIRQFSHICKHGICQGNRRQSERYLL